MRESQLVHVDKPYPKPFDNSTPAQPMASPFAMTEKKQISNLLIFK